MQIIEADGGIAEVGEQFFGRDAGLLLLLALAQPVA